MPLPTPKLRHVFRLDAHLDAAVFIAVGARQPRGVSYDVYLVE